MRVVFLIYAVGVLASVQAQDPGTTTTTGANTEAAAGDTTTNARTRNSGGGRGGGGRGEGGRGAGGGGGEGGQQTRFLGPLLQAGLSTLNNVLGGGRPNRPFNSFGGGRPINFGGRPVNQGSFGGRPINGGFQQGGFQQGGFRPGGFNQGGFQQGGFNQGGFNQGGFNQGGFHQGGRPIHQGGRPIGFQNQGSFGGLFNQKRGACPPLRPTCPRHGGVGPPINCVNDRQCGGIDKCCADVCLPNELVCKTPLF